jgi:hypothetical protein
VPSEVAIDVAAGEPLSAAVDPEPVPVWLAWTLWLAWALWLASGLWPKSAGWLVEPAGSDEPVWVDEPAVASGEPVASGDPVWVDEPAVASGEPVGSGEPVWVDAPPVASGEPVCVDAPAVASGEPVGSGEPVWVDAPPVASGEPVGSDGLGCVVAVVWPACSVWVVCAVWLVWSLRLCCAAVPGSLAGASVPPLLGLAATALEFAVADSGVVGSAWAAVCTFAPADSDALADSAPDASAKLTGAAAPPAAPLPLVLKELAVDETARSARIVAVRARERLALCELLERTAIMRAARTLPRGRWLMRLLTSESICDPAPIGPGG